MSTFTKNQRNLVSVLISAALISLSVVAAPAQAAATGPLCGPSTNAVVSCGGTTSDGAKYAMQVPDNFNGTVFLYSHGYTYAIDIPGKYTMASVLNNPVPGPIGPLAPTTVDMVAINSLLASGYAVVGSTFPVLGWNVKEAVATNVELIGIFKKKFTDTKKVIAWGESLGAFITQALAEKYPKLIDGAGLMCPALGSVAAELTTAGDFLWGLKTMFAPTITGRNYAAGDAGKMQVYTDLGILESLGAALKTSIGTELVTNAPSWPAGAPGAVALGSVPVRSVILYLGLMSGIPTRSAHLDGISGPGAAGSTSAFGFATMGSPALAVLQNGFDAAGLAVLATYDLEKQSGGAFFDNTKTDYAKRTTVEKSVFNAPLSGATAIAGIEKYLANPAVTRWAATPAAAAKFATQIKHTGKLSHPTVVLAATEDPITPEGNTQWLINRQKTAAAKAKLLVIWNKPADQYTTFTAAGQPDTSGPKANGTGHCNFTADQYLAVANILSDAVESNGKLDTGVVRENALANATGLSITPRTGRMQKYYQK